MPSNKDNNRRRRRSYSGFTECHYYDGNRTIKLKHLQFILSCTLLASIILFSVLIFFEKKKSSHNTTNKKSSSYISNNLLPAILSIQNSVTQLDNKIFRAEKVKDFKNAVANLESLIEQIDFNSDNLMVNDKNKLVIKKIRLASSDLIMKGKMVERIVNNHPNYKMFIEPPLIKLTRMTQNKNWENVTSNFGKDLISVIEDMNTPYTRF